MSGHTPGPWRVDPLHSLDVQTWDGKLEIASPFKAGDADSEWTVMGPCPSSEEAEANARLIAAAPELLEALRGAFLVTGWSERAALASERGEDPEQWDQLVREWTQLAIAAIAKAESKP